jgi:hypothetical protein
MKPICAICTAALAISCGASESHNSSQSGATARTGQAEPNNQPKVTLKGCLQDADRPKTAGTAGSDGSGSAGAASDQMTAAGRGSPGERFTLTYATAVAGATDPSAGSYVLDGNLEALRANVNREVQLTGTLDAAYANNPQRIRVDSIQALGGSCMQR